MPFDTLERLAVKRQKLIDPKLYHEPAVNGHLNNKGAHNNATLPLNSSLHSKTEIQKTNYQMDNQHGQTATHNGFTIMHKLYSTSGGPASQTREQEPKINSLQPSQLDSGCSQQQLANSQHRRKKSKKHKDKERERLKEDRRSEQLKSSPDLKQNPDKLDSKTPLLA